MAIRIEAPTAAERWKAWSDLLSVCRESTERMSFDVNSGEVLFLARVVVDGTASQVCEALATDFYEVVIVPRTTPETAIVDPWVPRPPPGVGGGLSVLCARGVIAAPTGFTTVGGETILSKIELVYDATDYPPLDGYRGYDESGREIPVAAPHLLAFGIGSAGQIAKQLRESRAAKTDPWTVDGNVSLLVENAVRAFTSPTPRVDPLKLYLPQCSAQPGKSDEPPPPPPKQGKNTGHGVEGWLVCFVAAAAVGSSFAPEVQVLREFRDNVLRRTRTIDAWFDRFNRSYYEVSSPIAAQMKEDPELANMLRIGIVQPYVGWLELAAKMPNASLSEVPEPWREFIGLFVDRMDAWAAELVPDNLGDLTGLDAARDLAVLLRYGYRDPGRRSAYLDRLAAAGMVPLRLSSAESDEARAILLGVGLTAADVGRVVDVAPQEEQP